MKKDDQQFGEWMRADTFRLTRKTVTIIQGSSRTQAPWWRKPGSKGAHASAQATGTSTPNQNKSLVMRVNVIT